MVSPWRFEHPTCTACEFLGSLGKYDIWTCVRALPTGQLTGSIYARFGNDTHEYRLHKFVGGKHFPIRTAVADFLLSVDASLAKEFENALER